MKGIEPPLAWDVEQLKPWLVEQATSLVEREKSVTVDGDLFQQGFDRWRPISSLTHAISHHSQSQRDILPQPHHRRPSRLRRPRPTPRRAQRFC